MNDRKEYPDDPLDAMTVLWSEVLPDEVVLEQVEQVKEEVSENHQTREPQR